MELLSPIPPTTNLPEGIHASVADATRVVRRVSDLKSRIFKYWAIIVFNHLNWLPGAAIYIVFDDYQYAYETPSKKEIHRNERE